MQLNLDSNTAYLIAEKAKSRIAHYFYCSNSRQNQKPKQTLNAPILVECKLLQHVVTSAAEAKIGALLYNCQTVVDICNMLQALGHPQQPIPVNTDNSMAASFVSRMVKTKRSKAWDVQYHWLFEKQQDKMFYIYWDKGENNLAKYRTKYHSPSHHQMIRNKYILKILSLVSKCTQNDDFTHQCIFVSKGVFIIPNM